MCCNFGLDRYLGRNARKSKKDSNVDAFLCIQLIPTSAFLCHDSRYLWTGEPLVGVRDIDIEVNILEIEGNMPKAMRTCAVHYDAMVHIRAANNNDIPSTTTRIPLLATGKRKML